MSTDYIKPEHKKLLNKVFRAFRKNTQTNKNTTTYSNQKLKPLTIKGIKNAKSLLEKTDKYFTQYTKLDEEYKKVPRIPIYHFFKKLTILNKMAKLTNEHNNYLEQKNGK